MKRATIHDVAKRAGVSIKTVSRVLNKEPNVRKETQARVAEVIRELKYRPSISARGLAGKRSYLLGLLYDNPSASYITRIQQGVLAACREESFGLLIHPCSYTYAGLEDEILEFIEKSRLDGLILTPPVTDLQPIRRMLDRRKVCTVLVSPGSLDTTPWSVSTNDREVSAEMVAYLAGLGHRRIAFILGHPDHEAIANRYLGYLEGMKAHGLRTGKTLQAQGYNSFESGVECAHRFLRRKNRPTAIFASNDDMAAGVIRTAHEMGITVPGQLSVVGFDDIPLASQIWPALTTIRQPIQRMADTATRLLISRLRKQSEQDIEREIRSRLVLRDSAGPVPIERL